MGCNSNKKEHSRSTQFWVILILKIQIINLFPFPIFSNNVLGSDMLIILYHALPLVTYIMYKR